MSKRHNFDEQIKQKLDGLQSSPLYGSWESFLEKLDADSPVSGLTDEEFDKKVHHRIHKLQPAFKSAHWEKLKYKLETIELFRRKILLHKAKEVAAVFLFLFTFYNVTIHQKNWIDGHLKIYVAADGTSVSETTKNQTIKADQSGFIQEVKKTSTNFYGQKIGGRSITNTSFSKTKSVLNIPSTFQEDEAQNFTLTEVRTNMIDENVMSKQPVEENQTNVIHKIVEVSSLGFPETETYSFYATIIPMALEIGPSKKELNRFGIQFAQVDNFILSPFDKVYSVPRFSNSTRNQSYGITYGKKRNRWELEAGLSYSRLEYKPAEVREIYGNAGEISFETSLQKIQFDIWKLPVSMKYYFVDKKSWRYYSLLGSTFNIISEADYSIEENIVLSRPLAPAQYTQDGPRLEEKPFTNGLFNDGKLSGNYYVDVFFGMGVELSVSKFASIYLQPGYHAFLFSEGIGIGPNNDKINAFQLQTGVKFHFTD